MKPLTFHIRLVPPRKSPAGPNHLHTHLVGWSCGNKRVWKLLKIPITSFSSFFFFFQAYHGFTGKQKGHFWCKMCQAFSFLSFAGHPAPGPLVTLVAPTFPPLPQFPSDPELCALSQRVAMAGEPVTVSPPCRTLGTGGNPAPTAELLFAGSSAPTHPLPLGAPAPMSLSGHTSPGATATTTLVLSHPGASRLRPPCCPQPMSLGSRSQLGSGHGVSQELLCPPGASPQQCVPCPGVAPELPGAGTCCPSVPR